MLRSRRRGHARLSSLASLVGFLILVLATPASARERPVDTRADEMCATVVPGTTSADVNGAVVTFTWSEDGGSWIASDADPRHFRVTVRLVDGTRKAVWGLTGSWFGDIAIDTVRPCHCPPPADDPPADDPPADDPPADEPPADEPPADEPPADEPPADEPPAEEPPADDPPAEEPPADEPPAEEPPADDPPAEEPPAEEPPAEEPPSEVSSGAVAGLVSVDPLPEPKVLAVKIVEPVASATVVTAQETLPVTGIDNAGLAAIGFSLLVVDLLMLRYTRQARPRRGL